MSLLGAFRATRPVLSAALTSAFATKGIHIRRHKPQTPEPKLVSSDEAVKCIQSKNRVFVHSAAAVPQELLRAMVRRHSELEDVEVCHIHIEGPETYQRPEYRKSFKGNNFFVGANSRKAIAEGRADFVPVFLSEIPLLFRRGVLPLDVALISLSPPDRHGYCSLGTSIDVTRSAVECARVVVAQINPHIPRTYGDSLIHLSDLDFVVEHSEPLPQREAAELLEEEKKIGEHIAQLVPNGATLQLGIGSVPDATLRMLSNHKELGIHTEMFSDGIVELVNQGVVTGMHKSVAPGKIVSSFAVGSQKLYDFMHENPTIAMLDCAFVNMPVIIMRNPKVIAINSCIQIDLTGQICADSIGSTIYSGIGGQMDFIRGAALSEGGKPIIAFTSTTSKGVSRIAPFLNEGAGVVTTRAHAHYIVTEYGVANLFGKNLRQRAEALISIAHPSHRESLTRAAQQRLKYV